MKKFLLLPTVLTLALSTAALAQMDMPGMDHSKTPMSGSSMNMMDMMDMMGMSDLNKLSGRAFDRAFLSMMIPHHQAAIEMSKAVLVGS